MAERAASFVVGIDLGTTHCAVASVETKAGAKAEIVDLPIPQLQRAGEVAPKALLPSCLYLPASGELPAGSTALPWGESASLVAGEFARWQGSRVPGRAISSAKSWLCHPGVDRSAAILPWGALPDVPKLSPVDASAKLLQHLGQAWDHAHPDAKLSAQEVVVTVPASFDEAARALTVSAIKQAGIERFTLLEEPQAAFYDFTARNRAKLDKALSGVRLVLVVDVGGGTTDFTLVQVAATPDGPVMKRLAVGEHLMLGGDNMDAALAHQVEASLTAGGKKLSATQWTQAVQLSRTAKEALLSEDAPERYGISLVGEGSKLFGGTLSGELRRDDARAAVLEGFFPPVTAADRPRKGARGTGLTELGLPYAQEPAVTRHLVAFLAEHAAAGFLALGVKDAPEGALPRPDALLLNGGVFNAPLLAGRLREVLSSLWPSAKPVPQLAHGSLEKSVARGAAWYGIVRRGLGLKIGGGAARAFYVGLQGVEGAPTQAVCLVPRGFEEGQSVELSGRSFRLTLGRPVQFPLFSSSADRVDVPGALVDVGSEAFRPLPPIHTLLRGEKAAGTEVPVHLSATLTEIGTLELSCVSDVSDERWRLEFELRGAQAQSALTVTESMPAKYADAVQEVVRIFGNKPLPVEPRDVKNLFRTLEKALGERDTWRLPLLREMWSALFPGAPKRRRSPDHEKLFFQLLGFSLRPGFGYPLDGFRASESFKLFPELLTHHGEKATWNEFWVAWRRMAGGLSEAEQQTLWATLRPALEQKLVADAPKAKKKGVQPEGLDEMVRCAASLEHLSGSDKAELGRWVEAKFRASPTAGGPWAWALGRIGGRAPIYGSGHKVVETGLAENFLRTLLSAGLGRVDGAPFAAVQLARRTGDRTRDISEGLRVEVLAALSAAKAPERWLELVRDVVTLTEQDEARALGDTLPAGLKL